MTTRQPEYLTGAYLEAWATASLAGLRRHREEINRLNVFPIPDSDTGTNMTATMECAVSRLGDRKSGTGGDATDGDDAATVAAALAAGAVAGARGNSGMVLGQILRAVADTASMSATGDLSARAVPAMLTRAGELVTGALSDPVEGTIVTVLRAAADGAHSAVDAASTTGAGNAVPAAGPGGEVSLSDVVTAARDAAVAALAETTGQLDVLTEAGVVDAGGRGLVVILEALVEALRGAAADDQEGTPEETADGVPDATHGTGAVAHLELVFSFLGDAGSLRELLDASGDSVVIVADGSGGHRAHVHTVHPGELIEAIFGLGRVSGLRIEVLPAPPVAEPPVPASPVIALLPAGSRGTGLGTLFAAAGATVADSAEALAAALRALGTQGTGGQGIVLTNGQDTAGLLEALEWADRQTTVVDTGSFVGGLAALAVYSPGADVEDNAEDMADAVHGQRIEDVSVDAAGAAGAAGAENADVDAAVTAVTDAAGRLLDDGGELVTVLYGDDLGDAGMAAVTVALAADHPDAEVLGVPVPGMPVTAQVGVE